MGKKPPAKARRSEKQKYDRTQLQRRREELRAGSTDEPYLIRATQAERATDSSRV